MTTVGGRRHLSVAYACARAAVRVSDVTSGLAHRGVHEPLAGAHRGVRAAARQHEIRRTVAGNSVVFACGSRTDLIGSPAGSSGDAGADPDARATTDANMTVDAGGMVDAVDGGACKIPAQASSSSPAGHGGCTPQLNWTSSLWCTSSQYELRCFGATVMSGDAPDPDSSLGCIPVPANDPDGGVYYCCPCEGE